MQRLFTGALDTAVFGARQTTTSFTARLRLAFFLAAAIALPPSTASAQLDPFEPFNRVTSSFNTGIDRLVFKPAAQAYQAVVPKPVSNSVSNFFSNLGDPWTAINQLLQGRVQTAGKDTGRFLVNSTIGLGGLFDVATGMGLPKHREDFEQTLAVWGVPQGPYIVLPMLGPSSARGLIGQYAGNFSDNIGQPITYVNDVPVRNSLFFTLLMSMRAAQLDRPSPPPQMDVYALTRDFYLQRLQQQIAE